MNGYSKSNFPTARQSGFSLLEVVISIVIASVGLLGLASMQATGLKSNHSAYHRSQATVLAYDMADRMRANMGSINDYLPKVTPEVEPLPDITPVEPLPVITPVEPLPETTTADGVQVITDPIDVIIVPVDPPVDPPVETDLSGCTSTSGCSSAELAQKDLLDWNSALLTAIPNGVGTITRTGDIYTVSISWDDNRNPDDGSETNVQVSFQL